MAYRVLIIGCGAIAGGYDSGRAGDAPPLTHAGAFSRDARFKIVACVDPDEVARTAFAERWGIAHRGAAVDELEARPGGFDVVSICSPTAFHAEHLAAALALKPRLIFCEKPLAGDVETARNLVDRCRGEGVALAVNYTRRWAPDLLALAAEIRSGKWGAPISAVGWYTKGVVHNGGHLADLLGMMLGELTFICAGKPVFDFWDDDPTVPALLRSADGANVHLAAGDTRAFTQFELVLTCEQGEIAVRDGGFRIETRKVQDSATFTGYRVLGERESVAGRYDEAMACAVANIADHLDHAKPLASTGANALAAQRLCEVIRTGSLPFFEDKPEI